MTINFNNISDAYARVNNLLSKIYAQNNVLLWEKNQGPHDYSNDYLTFEIVGNGSGTIGWNVNESSSFNKTIYYRKNKTGNFNSLTVGNTINVEKGDIIEFYGDNNAYANGTPSSPQIVSYRHYFSSDIFMNVYGNIMSLIDSSNFRILNTIPTDYCFLYLFDSCSKIINAENLILPATTLTGYCYQGMFRFCTSLTTAPVLPATTLSPRCYGGMFYKCTSLTTAPELPATTLAESCYMNMFQGCTGLIAAPSILPATTLAHVCCWGMFNGCTSLTTAPELPATTLDSGCYLEMFVNCTSLTTAPELPATTLFSNSYRSMFYNCTNLNYIKCLATDISATDCTIGWVDGVSNTGTFIKDVNATWSIGASGIPSGWTVSNV